MLCRILDKRLDFVHDVVRGGFVIYWELSRDFVLQDAGLDLGLCEIALG